jgi:hypothetical protein
MTIETLAMLSISTSVPLSVALFKLLPLGKKEDTERRHAPISHLHPEYVPRNECTLNHKSTDILMEGIGRDLRDIKARLDSLDEYIRDTK